MGGSTTHGLEPPRPLPHPRTPTRAQHQKQPTQQCGHAVVRTQAGDGGGEGDVRVASAEGDGGARDGGLVSHPLRGCGGKGEGKQHNARVPTVCQHSQWGLCGCGACLLACLGMAGGGVGVVIECGMSS